MKKVVLESERCIKCGACVSVAQENFEYGEEGESVLINDTVTDKAIEAAEMCPVSAIQIVEEQEEAEEEQLAA